MKRGWIFLLWATAAIAARAASMHWESLGIFSPGSTLFKGVRFGNCTFVAWGENLLVYTQDGLTWRRRGEGFTPAGQINSVAYGGGRFVAVGKTGHAAVSKDGAHWNTQLISGPAAFFDVAYGAGLFVAVGENGLIATSPDGLTWMLQTGTAGIWR